MNDSSSRREFLRWSAGFSVMGAAAPMALQLTAAGSASAQTASDYKAIVCLFMSGGQDGNNMVLATDTGSFARYTSARNTGIDAIALKPPGFVAVPSDNKLTPDTWGGVRPIRPATLQAVPAGTVLPAGVTERTFAIHPLLAPLAPKDVPDGTSLWEQKRLAVLANVGTLLNPLTKTQFVNKQAPIPPALFSHNDQQSAWQSGAIDGAQTGWGGRIGDILGSMNGGNTIFTSISADGNAVFVSGNVVNQYQISTDGTPAITINGRSGSLFGSKSGAAALNSIIQNVNAPSNFAADHATVVQRSITASSALNAAFNKAAAQAIPDPPTFFEPAQGFEDVNPWTTQLHTVAQMIAAAPSLGVKRQVFFLRLDQHDTHDHQNERESLNLARIAQALTWFDGVLANIGGVNMRNNVTTFTASDFSRGFATNGSGTDHAWGGHHFIMGGAVKGGDMYGQYPTLGVDVAGFNNPDIAGNNMIPTTSVDQYGATLARWMGVQDTDLNTIFPNLRNYSTPVLGFL
jgi:uncharacterized protein (DUF1501 family)